MPAAVFWMMGALRRGHYAADDAISRLETQMAAADEGAERKPGCVQYASYACEPRPLLL